MAKNTIKPKKQITITNARVNNLQDVSCDIPRNALTVISGVSGSGKSSLHLKPCMLKVREDSLNHYHPMPGNFSTE